MQSILFVAVYGNWRNSGILSGADSGSGLFYSADFYKETMRIKAWTGYEAGGVGEEDDQIVYVTDTGVVYHKNPHCTHLDLSIHAAASSELNSLRNENGGKYHACEKCVHGSSMGGSVYITDQGDRYHNSLTCSGLKRTVYTARISEVPGKRACSKCGGK